MQGYICLELPKTSLVYKIPFLINLPPANLEWLASFFWLPCPLLVSDFTWSFQGVVKGFLAFSRGMVPMNASSFFTQPFSYWIFTFPYSLFSTSVSNSATPTDTLFNPSHKRMGFLGFCKLPQCLRPFYDWTMDMRGKPREGAKDTALKRCRKFTPRVNLEKQNPLLSQVGRTV